VLIKQKRALSQTITNKQIEKKRGKVQKKESEKMKERETKKQWQCSWRPMEIQ